MFNRRMMMLALLPALLATFVVTSAFAGAEVGKPAPDFTLTDTDGKSHSLADFKGKIVVLEWINPDCPVCRRVMSTGVVKKMQKELKALDPEIVHIAINSTNYMDAQASAAYLKKNEMKIPALVDQDGTVGRLYGARTTPHMYVIDKEGVLRYEGAIDDDRRGGRADATNYVVNAVTLIVAGETVTPDKTKPYGCSVKYKKK